MFTPTTPFREGFVRQQLQAGLLALGSPRTLRLPAMHVDNFDNFDGLHSGQFAELVPDYSGGTTTDLHRLPFSLAPAMPAYLLVIVGEHLSCLNRKKSWQKRYSRELPELLHC